MPIRPEEKDKYPKNWKEIRKRILKRAKNRCEFRDESRKRCKALNHKPHPITGSRVVLTIAHLDHNPENCDDKNLKAGCQRCHNRYDIKHRVEGIKKRKIEKVKKEHRCLTSYL